MVKEYCNGASCEGGLKGGVVVDEGSKERSEGRSLEHAVRGEKGVAGNQKELID